MSQLLLLYPKLLYLTCTKVLYHKFCTFCPLFKTAAGQQTFYYNIVRIRNALDTCLKLIVCQLSVHSFKRCFMKQKLTKEFLNK